MNNEEIEIQQQTNNFIKKSFFDYDDLPKEKQKFWFNQQEINEICDQENLIAQSQVSFQKNILKRFYEQESEMEDIVLKVQGDLISYTSNDNPQNEGFFNINRIKVEFFENLSDEKIPVIGEDFCILLSHDKQFETIFCKNEKDFRETVTFFRQKCVLTHFNKEYVSHSIVGQGTFAKVILATRNSDQKKFAVKTYNKKKLIESNKKNISQQGLFNEIHIMRHIKHENIINLHEVFEGEQHIYLVMDLLKGGELFDRIVNQSHFGEKDSFEIIFQLINAIQHVHSYRVMHRDIKPENLILRDEDSLKLCLADFGLSEFVTSKHRLLTRCGTPGYVAPEVLQDLKYDERVDVFSCGVILYNLLTGCQVFGGDEFNEVINKNENCIINWQFEKINIFLSIEAIDLLKKMLEKDPNKRITIPQIYQHPWIKKYIGDNKIPQDVQNVQFYESNLKNLDVQKQNNKNMNKIKDQFSDQICMNTPIMTGRTKPFQESSPINTPNLNSSIFKGRKNEIKQSTNILNKYTKQTVDKNEMASNKETEKINQKSSAKVNNVTSKLKKMDI